MSVSLDAIAAFLAGVASILGAGYSIRRARREERELCDQRLETYQQGIERGLHMSERKENG